MLILTQILSVFAFLFSTILIIHGIKSFEKDFSSYGVVVVFVIFALSSILNLLHLFKVW